MEHVSVINLKLNLTMKFKKSLIIKSLLKIRFRSKYMQMLPPLPIHCIALDGETATMPVIFEDQYQDPFEAKKRASEVSLTQIPGK